MTRKIIWMVVLLCSSSLAAMGQQAKLPSADSLKMQILELELTVDQIQFNLAKSQKKFQRGIAFATVGYTVTIIGGLLLGRSQDQLGQTLLVVGGATGVTGTFMLVDSFKYLGRAGQKRKR
ncbi:hypothetical protein BH09BAC3_BH09BAC3_27760 [soil metagenome]